MNKFYENIILSILVFIVVYNLLNHSIFEGNGKRKKIKKLRSGKKKLEQKYKPQNILSNKNSKDNQQDKEIASLNNKLNDMSTTLRNTHTITNQKLPLLLNHMKSQSAQKLNKIQEQISNNKIKNNELKSFSENKGRQLQGNIDLLSSDLANNNIEYTDQMKNVENKLTSLQNKINVYEKNNSNVENMLKNINLQLRTKYVDK